MTTVPWSEVREDTSGREGSTEWNFFLREVGRLLAEGHEGKWVLVQGEAVVGVCDTRDEAFAAAGERHRRGETCLTQQVTARAPVIRLPLRMWHLWPS
jgi:hypothetical protein